MAKDLRRTSRGGVHDQAGSRPLRTCGIAKLQKLAFLVKKCKSSGKKIRTGAADASSSENWALRNEDLLLGRRGRAAMKRPSDEGQDDRPAAAILIPLRPARRTMRPSPERPNMCSSLGLMRPNR